MTGVERRWLTLVFAALLPPAPLRSPQDGGIRQTVIPPFWGRLARAAPTFTPGLRVMLAAVLLLPIFDRRFLRPFPLLSAAEREAFLVSVDARSDYVSRQLVATFKILACFAWYDADDANHAADRQPRRLA